MANSLAGKVAVITGASRGIGRSIAERLARDGATVIVNYARGALEAAEVVREIQSNGGKALALQADVANLTDIERLFSQVESTCGGLDIVVANAGRCVFKPFLEISEIDFDEMFALNAKGTFFVLQAALRRIRDHGRIICLSTIGTVLNPVGGSAYFGSKAPIEQFCRTLGREVAARNITVNVVSPGFTATDMLLGSMAAADHAALIEMTPLNRLGTPLDIAEVVAFLASDAAGWVTRQNIAVDGGIVGR